MASFRRDFGQHPNHRLAFSDLLDDFHALGRSLQGVQRPPVVAGRPVCPLDPTGPRRRLAGLHAETRVACRPIYTRIGNLLVYPRCRSRIAGERGSAGGGRRGAARRGCDTEQGQDMLSTDRRRGLPPSNGETTKKATRSAGTIWVIGDIRDHYNPADLPLPSPSRSCSEFGCCRADGATAAHRRTRRPCG